MTTPIENLRPYLDTKNYLNLTRAQEWGPAYKTVEEVQDATDAALLDRRNMGPKGVDAVRDAIAALRTGKPRPPTVHRPQRGSDVEAWIERARDAFAHTSDRASIAAWAALDDLLDDYQLHADTGATLDVPADELTPGAEQRHRTTEATA